MAEETGITVENLFQPPTVKTIMRYDQRLKSLALVDTRRILKNSYRGILDFMADNSDPIYGPRATSEEIAENIRPARADKYSINNVETYCMDLQRAGVLKRVKRPDGSKLWVYMIPDEMLPKECRDISSLMEQRGLKLEEIADKVDMEESLLERAVEIMRYQYHFS